MLSSLCFMGLFYGLCIYALVCNGGKNFIKCVYKEVSVLQHMVLIGVVGFSMMFVIFWIKQNHYIYYWDYSGYWTYSINRMNYMFNNSFKDNVFSLYQSINNDDYNVFLPSVIAFPLSVFGYTFAKYVEICCVMFLIPAFLVQGLTVAKMIRNENITKNNLFIIGVIVAICFAPSYFAGFRGYIDVAFLLPMSIVMYLFVDYDFKSVSMSRNIAIALMLVMIWICRRYTIFFLIGFVVAMVTKAIIGVILEKEIGLMRNSVTNFLQIGIISLGVLIVFFRSFFFRALFTNYGEMYSAYDAPITQKVASVTAAFGYIFFVLIAITGVLCFISKKQIDNYISLGLMGIFETIIFWQTQNMGVHHRMILNLPIFLLLMLILEQCEGRGKCVGWRRCCVKKFFIAVYLMMILINFIKAFSTDVSSQGCGKIFSERYYPLKRTDIDSLKLLATELNKMTNTSEEYIYVAASGKILNCDILRKLYMPNSENAIPNMLNTCDVDLRDGFPTDFLRAKYVVTTDPVQTHLATGQEVVTYLANGVMDKNSYIGCHYDLIDEIELDNGIIAKIYSKNSDFLETDLQKMKDYYMNLYPGYEELFADRIYY